MNFETTKHVLDHVREFHGRIGEYYKRLGDHNSMERVKMLLDYLSRHEKHFQESMKEYEEAISKQILNTWFKFPPCQEMTDINQAISLDENPDMTVDDVIETALKMDDCLIRLYTEMAARSPATEVREVFENLLKMEKKRELNMVRDTLRFNDI